MTPPIKPPPEPLTEASLVELEEVILQLLETQTSPLPLSYLWPFVVVPRLIAEIRRLHSELDTRDDITVDCLHRINELTP